MKKAFICILLVAFYSGCKAPGDKKLAGEWEITRFVYAMVNQKTVVSEEDELKEAGAFWNLKLAGNGDFKQEFNMRNMDKKTEVETGSWSAYNDTLKIIINTGSREVPQFYTYKFEGDLLVLTMKGRNDLSQVVSTFRKK